MKREHEGMWALRKAAFGLTMAAVIGLSLAGQAQAQSARTLSEQPLAESQAWKRSVVDEGKTLVYARRVTTLGDAAAVTNPAGLKDQGGSATTIRATGAGTPRLTLDLGRDTGGYVEVGITRTDGTKVQLAYAEYRPFLTPVGDNCGCAALGFSLGTDDKPDARSDVIDSARPTVFRSPGVRGAQRYINLQLQGAGSVSIDYVRVRPTHLRTPASAHSGSFHSSDTALNRIWAAGVYTFGLDSFRDRRTPGSKFVVTDGGKRDRLIWAGDLGVENLLGAYSLKRSPEIIRTSLRAFSCLQYADGQLTPATPTGVACPGTPTGKSIPPLPAAANEFPAAALAVRLPEYTASWIIALHDYWLYTGDRDFARRMMPVVRRGLKYFADNMRNGLFVTPSTGLVINWHPFDKASGVDSHANATLFRALQNAADLERAVGSGGAAGNSDDRRAAVLRRAMARRLWDSKAGAFLLNSEDPRRNHSQDAQVEAIYSGLATSSQSRRALHFISSKLLRKYGVANGEFNDDAYMSNYISPYISSTELLARMKEGDTEGALSLIRRTWTQMLRKGPGTLWERMAFSGQPANYADRQAPTEPFVADGAGFTSLAHGWGGGPVPALSGYVLGIRPTAPGFSSWIVAPQPGDLRFAQGRAGTPRGALVSRWKRGKAGRSFTLTVAGPRRTSGTVEVPLLGRRRAIAMDGKIVWTGRRARRGVHAESVSAAVAFRGIRGRHTFAWVGRDTGR